MLELDRRLGDDLLGGIDRGTGADGEGRAMGTPKPDPKAAAHKLLGGKATAPAAEARPTFDQLFPEQTEQLAPTEEISCL